MSQSATPVSDPRRLLDDDTGSLACGENIDELLEQAADGRADQLTEHQRTCPHCRAALREFARLWQPVHDLASTRVDLPAAVRTAVAERVRQLVADVWYTLQLTDGGVLRIAARVVAVTAREAARTVPGVRVAFGTSTASKLAALVEKATLGHRHPNAAVGVLGRTAVVDLAVAVDYGAELDAVALQVQQRVITELRTTIGLKDVTVNVTVDDVFI